MSGVDITMRPPALRAAPKGERVHNPLDVAVEKLLVPAILSIPRGMRSKNEHHGG